MFKIKSNPPKVFSIQEKMQERFQNERCLIKVCFEIFFWFLRFLLLIFIDRSSHQQLKLHKNLRENNRGFKHKNNITKQQIKLIIQTITHQLLSK